MAGGNRSIAIGIVSMIPLLAADERSRAERFRFDHHRHRYIAARETLRRLLAAYADIVPEDVVFRYGPRGKPAVDAPAVACAIDFNVSHRGDYALYAFCRWRELGVDIEFMHEVPQALAIGRKHFTPEESCVLQAADAAGRVQECFFRLWTRKEAVIKAVGTGLSMPLSQNLTSVRWPKTRCHGTLSRYLLALTRSGPYATCRRLTVIAALMRVRRTAGGGIWDGDMA